MTSSMKTIVLLLASFVTTTSVCYAFSTQDLKKLIREQDLRSVEDVLPFLPKELRNNFTVQHQGFGLQGATSEKPRIILFGKDGKFILTFNGSNEQNMGNDLEILEFNEKKNEFELHHVAFTPEAVKYDQNLSTCLSCHTSSADSKPFPIWGRYPSWRGSFGSLEDRIIGKEKVPFENFQRTALSHPRYQHLIFPDGSSASPYSDDRTETVTFRPNSTMGSYLARLNAKSIAKTISTRANFEKFLLLVSPSFFNCKEKMEVATLQKLNLKMESEYRALSISRKFSNRNYYDLENLSFFLGSSTYAFGQHSYGIVNTNGEIILQTNIFDPYYLDTFYLFTPNYVLSELSVPFFAKYPELKNDYDLISISSRLGKNKRLNQTPRDAAILKMMDELGQPLYLKEEKCVTFTQILAKEFSL